MTRDVFKKIKKLAVCHSVEGSKLDAAQHSLNLGSKSINCLVKLVNYIIFQIIMNVT